MTFFGALDSLALFWSRPLSGQVLVQALFSKQFSDWIELISVVG
jgi:hypothetical protein